MEVDENSEPNINRSDESSLPQPRLASSRAPLILGILALVLAAAALTISINARSVVSSNERAVDAFVSIPIITSDSVTTTDAADLYAAPTDLATFISQISKSVVVVYCGESQGSGWSMDLVLTEGYLSKIVTNHHVIKDCIDKPEDLKVAYGDDELIEYEAVIYIFDEDNDLAILDVKVNVPVLLEAESFALPGHWSMTIGTPTGFAKELFNAVTIGNITAVEDEYYNFTSAVINPGNSGGPLVNSRGEVIGVNSYGWASTEDGISNVAIDTVVLCVNVVDC